MKNFFLLLPVVALMFGLTSCSYDDSEIWDAVNDIDRRVETLEKATAQMNGDIKSLQSLLEAMKNNVTITSITPTENGYRINFSDGTEATISNGIDGASAPEISVKKADDGLYYWTIGGEWLIVDGERVRATGLDGNDAVAPKVRINPTTGEWEISTDGGQIWTSTGISAKGESGESIFADIDTSNPSYVKFTLTDGTQFTVQRYDASAPLFAVEGIEGVQIISNGESKTYNVTTANVASYSIQKPDGWRASFDDSKLTITSPAPANTYAEQEGSVDIIILSEAGTSMIVRIPVATFEIRTLTFEDADAKFPAYTIGEKSISTWSDLIDSPQYGGLLLYGESGYGGEIPYTWWDKGNTELKSTINDSYGYYAYWNGGHAISNYAGTDLSQGDFSHQLTVYGAGGHNGSQNFAVHFGYRDNSPYKQDVELPALVFGDGEEHVIESMWVMNTVYAMNCYVSGNGLTAKIGPDDWVKLVAIGFDKNGDKVGETTFYTCDGPDNIVMNWTKWDLSVLGKVNKVELNVTGSSDNGAGFSQPAYFAFDDVAVRF